MFISENEPATFRIGSAPSRNLSASGRPFDRRHHSRVAWFLKMDQAIETKDRAMNSASTGVGDRQVLRRSPRRRPGRRLATAMQHGVVRGPRENASERREPSHANGAGIEGPPRGETRANAVSEPRERSGDRGAPASERVGSPRGEAPRRRKNRARTRAPQPIPARRQSMKAVRGIRRVAVRVVLGAALMLAAVPMANAQTVSATPPAGGPRGAYCARPLGGRSHES